MIVLLPRSGLCFAVARRFYKSTEPRRIRKSTHPQAGSIRIIAMSANTFSDDVHAALESCMNAHVGKPIDMDVLADVLSAVL